MTDTLPNLIAGEWQLGGGDGTVLSDPVTGEALVRVSSQGLDLDHAFDHARGPARMALLELGYAQRAALLGEVAKVLQSHRDDYYEIALRNSGTVRADSAVDIEGAIFTLSAYARSGTSLDGDAVLATGQALPDGAVDSLSRDASFGVRHLLTPTPGVALFINAFNFPAWGLWEKAAPALLSGVPVIVKPATGTAWLTQRMVADVVAAGVLPRGALSIVCGSAEGLLDRIEAFDVVSFTGSAQTATRLRTHPAFVVRGARLNVEADSLNSAILAADVKADDSACAQFVAEIVREMTVKSGQKCTAIRRAFVPAPLLAPVADALRAALAGVRCGDPRDTSVTMGSLVSRAQWQAAHEGLEMLAGETERLVDGRRAALIGIDPERAACMAPSLLLCPDPEQARRVHDLEVFGPVATLAPYEVGSASAATDRASSLARLPEARAVAYARRGGGSLVASVYGSDETRLAHLAAALASTHGRVHVVSPSVAKTQTGHGNVMPQAMHGGPGRAGGGEELGGLRALNFYHRRSAVQGPAATLAALAVAPEPLR
ncbi:3,4-dehydroadipyl-CoA semialdehyde dehydrogenase [Chitinasiproducens palmae]|uniref:3,4-dehydroadipyl-CoA semialdehyde dehydrogenase n=1 Tax=Chitinasiproducens palmae TaxID=1770053 RepID=A0A1H2PS14_9BURK|nr:3,4-dehydroadipyl-CoA semialdehyde dehydrogenase [Chitinasiproducens palmae]SDV49730.1 3,4-dehydroadipyl-CoA semialdehyde dehydrogenase [Chitinasiproducens palmae]